METAAHFEAMMKQFAFAVGRLRQAAFSKWAPLYFLLSFSPLHWFYRLPSSTACCALKRKNLSPGASILIDDCLVLGINYNSSHFVLRLRMDSGRTQSSKEWGGGRRNGNNGACFEAVD